MRLLLLAAAAAAVAEDGEVCLLTLKSGRSQTANSNLWAARASAMAEWTERHSRVKEALHAAWLRRRETEADYLNVAGAPDVTGAPDPATDYLTEGSTEVDMDKFIQQSHDSADNCHAKVLEVKRTLDGLHAKVNMINAEMEANTEILETQTRIQKDKEEEIKEAVKDHEAAVAECDRQKDADHLRVVEIAGWIDELVNYANPEVRSSIATDIKYHEEAAKYASKLAAHKNATTTITDDQANEIVREIQEQAAKEAADAAGTSSLAQLQESIRKWDRAQCDKVAERMQQDKARVRQAVQNATVGMIVFRELDCNASRAVLQEEFAKAYTELTELKKREESDRDSAHALCVEEADGKLAEERARLNAAIQAATKNSMRAWEIDQSLSPLLQDAERALAKVQQHLEELLGSCVVEDSVSAHLDRVRDLIVSLQKCPGRHDFKLSIPGQEAPA